MAIAGRYVRAIRKLQHPGVVRLWSDVLAGSTPNWPDGFAFEHLILRAFELERATVRYPFDVNLPTGIASRSTG